MNTLFVYFLCINSLHELCILYIHGIIVHVPYSSSQKKVTFSFRSALSRRHRTVLASRSIHIIGSPTRIDSFILPQSSQVFWGNALLPLFDFGRVLQSRLDWNQSSCPKVGWSISHCQSILITSKCDHTDRAMRLASTLQVYFLCDYDWNSWLYVLSFACHCPPLSSALSCFHFFVHETAILLPSGWDGTEWKHHHFSDATVHI